MISVSTLVAAGVAPTQARQWAPALAAAALRFGIDRPVREAAWISQCAHESGGFKHLVENLNYSAAALRATWPAQSPKRKYPRARASRIALVSGGQMKISSPTRIGRSGSTIRHKPSGSLGVRLIRKPAPPSSTMKLSVNRLTLLIL